MIRGLGRVSIVVKDLDDSLAFYRDALGLEVVTETDLADRGLRMVRLGGPDAEIELMQPTDPSGPLGIFLETHGEGLHHVAVLVEDIEQVTRSLLARGVEMIDREPREGPGSRVAFVQPRAAAGVLVELYEPNLPTKIDGHAGEEK